MATIVTRSGKGSALTHTEMDANFNNLNNGKVETSAIGTAAASDVTTSATDTTAGRLLKVGDFGVGTWPTMSAVYPDLNNVLVNINGLYARTALNLPTTHNYYVNTVKSIGSGTLFQVAHKQASTSTYKRYNSTGLSSGWSAWQEIYHTGNEQQIGVNQTWQDVKASRSAGVTYTNTTGKPIQVALLWGDNTLDVHGLTIGGVFVVAQSYTSTPNETTMCLIVPNGSTYVATLPANYKWFELR